MPEDVGNRSKPPFSRDLEDEHKRFHRSSCNKGSMLTQHVLYMRQGHALANIDQDIPGQPAPRTPLDVVGPYHIDQRQVGVVHSLEHLLHAHMVLYSYSMNERRLQFTSLRFYDQIKVVTNLRAVVP